MARIRTIKPEFWTSEQIVECSTNARLLFVGLLNFCDDGGVHVASTKRLKMEVFPGDPFTDSDLGEWVEELIAVGLLCLFESQDQRYWWVTGWERHQKIDKPNRKYRGPFDDGSTIIRRTFDDHSTTEGSLRESKGIDTLSSPEATADDPEEPDESPDAPPAPKPEAIFEEWNALASKVPVLSKARLLTKERRAKLKTRLNNPDWLPLFREGLGKLPVPNDDGFTWQPGLDWLIENDKNVVKLAEGQYDKRNGDNSELTPKTKWFN